MAHPWINQIFRVLYIITFELKTLASHAKYQKTQILT